MPKKQQKLIGVQLPLNNKGQRKSTSFNKNIWIAAAGGVTEDSKDEANGFIKNVQNEKNWRHNYIRYVCDHMRLCEEPEDCLGMAKAGWEYVYTNMEVFREENGPKQSLKEAMATPNINKAFDTGVIQPKSKPVKELVIPYKSKNFKGQNAVKLIKNWKTKGVIESDTAAVLNSVVADKSVFDSLSNKVFVLLGAISEMGPLQRLLSWGATVVAIDINFQSVQDRLFKFAENSAGTLIVPLKKGTGGSPQSQWTEFSGANLLTDFPEVAAWLINIMPEKEMIIGSYCYLDGERFIKIVSTMDAICTTVAAGRKTTTGFSYLATPTDCHLVTEEAVTAANNQQQSAIVKLLSIATSNGYNKNDLVGDEQFTNSVVNRQGPNYILAKRLQTWRAMLHRNSGSPVSLNVAPTTKTFSVMKNKIFAFTMAGMESFAPMEPFETGTTKSVMAALLVWDFHSKTSSAQPTTELDHPLQLLQKTQVHGGMYRTGLLFETMGTPAFLIAAASEYWWVFAMILAAVGYLLQGSSSASPSPENLDNVEEAFETTEN